MSLLARASFRGTSLRSPRAQPSPRLLAWGKVLGQPSSASASKVSHHIQGVQQHGGRGFATTATPAQDLAETEAAEKEVPEKPPMVSNEKVVGQHVKHEFQAETKKLLDIVARSLYTDKEVFVREVISNSSDALEKLRQQQLTGEPISDPDIPLQINIQTDEKAKTLTIQDTGVGMNDKELIANLGSIGHSGSLDFVKQLKEKNASSQDIIGQFGVGFYSVFMVSNHVTVYSKSSTPGSKGYCWTSDGSGSYDLAEAEGVDRGTKIIIALNSKNTEFAQKEVIDKIIKKYSNFVGFDIFLNGEKANTVKALWTMPKNEITPEQSKEFYQFVAHAHDSPLFSLHYSTDSPISIKALFYVGQMHNEKYGLARMEPGVNLFTRKVLIQSKANGLLPDYLRFIKGVVDSEDIPLNLSREHLQDSSLVRRLNNVLTKRILKWLEDEARMDPKKYEQFWKEFGSFLKEGICSDFAQKEDLAKLLRFESSQTTPGQLTSFEEYLSRMPAEQKEIYYLCVPDRSLAESSPYFEAFKAKNTEVIFLFTQMDDFVMGTLSEYHKKKLLSIESAKAPSSPDKEESEEARLTSDEVKDLAKWMKEVLVGKVSSVSESNRLVDSPAIIVDHESASFRRMMKYVDPQRSPTLPKQQLEINPKHPIIKSLSALRNRNPALSKMIAEQVFDNALVSAGLLEDARGMLPRLTKIMEQALHKDETPSQ